MPFRYHDVLGLSKGGFLIGTYGTEDVLVPFIQAFRALPAVVFDDVPSAGDPLVKVRRKVFDGKTYLYAINTSDKPSRVTLDVPPGTEDRPPQGLWTSGCPVPPCRSQACPARLTSMESRRLGGDNPIAQ